MASIEPLMRRFFVLHARMQHFFRAGIVADTAQLRGRGTRTSSTWSSCEHLQAASTTR